MTEFWEEAFKEKHEMWGFEPAKSAVLTKDLFLADNVRNVLIPGIGYGHQTINQEFSQAGLVEISQVAENYPFHFIKCRKVKY